MISFEAKGDLKRTTTFLNKMAKGDIFRTLERYGQDGVNALASNTPVDSGATAGAWGYEVEISGRSSRIVWTNSATANGTPIVILLQYGHGTGTGGYVQGRDFINPAIAPIFDKIADNVWKAVTTA